MALKDKNFHISVLGSGVWGQALAAVSARAGTPTVLWGRRPPASGFGKGAMAGVRFEPVLSQAVQASAILLAVPCQSLRSVLKQIKPYLDTNTRLVNCAKGIERESLAFPSDMIREEIGLCPSAVLSGPSFAEEVMEGAPTLVTLAACDSDNLDRLATALWSVNFRPYISDDVRGVELGGAVKNVFAIACGAASGLKSGENTKSALISRAFAEMSRFGEAEGARASTLFGLSGLGDLVLSCSSLKSRNFKLGQIIAEAGAIQNVRLETLPLSEGAKTAPALLERAHKKGVRMPITEHVVGLLNGEIDIKAVVSALLERPLKSEV